MSLRSMFTSTLGFVSPTAGVWFIEGMNACDEYRRVKQEHDRQPFSVDRDFGQLIAAEDLVEEAGFPFIWVLE